MVLFSKKKLAAWQWSDRLNNAISQDKRETFMALLDKEEVDINEKGSDGYPLQFCVACDRIDYFDILVEKGANISLPSPLLIDAVGYKHYEFAKRLIALGVNVNQQETRSGFTALHNAAARGQGKLVDLLLSAGADPNIKTNNYATAADIALSNNQPHIAEHIRQHMAVAGDWIVSGEREISHVSNKPVLGLTVTEIFNFAHKNYINIVFNEKAKTQSHVVKTFAELAETSLVEEAAAQISQHGIVVDTDNRLLHFGKAMMQPAKDSHAGSM